MDRAATLEERITALEGNVRELLAEVRTPKFPKNWRRTVGSFSGDELMKEIDREGQKIRSNDQPR